MTNDNFIVKRKNAIKNLSMYIFSVIISTSTYARVN